MYFGILRLLEIQFITYLHIIPFLGISQLAVMSTQTATVYLHKTVLLNMCKSKGAVQLLGAEVPVPLLFDLLKLYCNCCQYTKSPHSDLKCGVFMLVSSHLLLT